MQRRQDDLRKSVSESGAAVVGRPQSELKRAFAEDGANKTHVGGQALIEGVMMRGRHNWAAAVREPSGGVYVEEHDLPGSRVRGAWLSWPIVRGCRAFVESLVLGYKALEVAALHAFSDDADAARPERTDEAAARGGTRQAAGDGLCGAASDSSAESRVEPEAASETDAASAAAGASLPASAEAARDDDSFEFGKKEMAVSMALGLVLGVALFIVAPALIANLLVGEYDGNTLAWNIVDGIVRVAVFVFYIWLIGRMRDIERMFGYHGAEHKTIHCFEHGLPLTPENARAFPRLHVRCGTAFLIMVMVVAILVYTITPLNALIAAWGVPDGPLKLALVIAARIVLMPPIAGISYEITVKWAGSRPDNPLVKVILWPGMQMQRLTTREPDDGQIECAIAAMRAVLEREEREATRA